MRSAALSTHPRIRAAHSGAHEHERFAILDPGLALRAIREWVEMQFGRFGMTALLFACLALTACGPNIGNLEKGEEGTVTRAFGGDTLELDSGLRVFLAEIDAPRGEEEYAAQSQGELEALALHRRVRLAYGGTKRWVRRVREGEPAPEEAQQETAIAHIFVQSEGGRWFWLQHELVSRGAAFVRPRRDNHARAGELVTLENAARGAERGLWGQRVYKNRSVRAAAEAALAANASCLRGDAPWRVIEGRVEEANASDRRGSLTLSGGPAETPFTIALFGESFARWDGPALASLTGAELRVRGPLGVFRGAPQLCLDDSRQLEVLTANPERTSPRPSRTAPGVEARPPPA